MSGADYIVCGWYTPDYVDWTARVRASLDVLREAHDFVQVDGVDGGWERNTLRKPFELRRAMQRHFGKTIIFLDVDCEVRSPLGDLATINSDIAAHFRCRQSAFGLPILRPRSGTLVVRPTDAARAFVLNWCHISAEAPSGAVDQRTLPLAIARTPGLAIGMLDVMYCAVASDNVLEPVILHDSASRTARKMPGWVRALHAFRGRLAA